MTVHRIDQGMAVAAAGLLPSPVTKEMRTRYRQLRMMLHTAGLAATYAFVAAKSGEDGEAGPLARAYRQAGEGLRKQLWDAGLLAGDWRQLTAHDVLRQLGEMSPVQYARASAEAQALASWLSRLADAMTEPARPARTDGAGHSGGETADGAEPAGDGMPAGGVPGR